MNFASPDNFIFFWVIPLCLLLLWFAQKVRKKRMLALMNMRINELLSHSYKPKRAFFKNLLLVLSIVLILISLARPRWGFEWKDLPQGGIDIMVVLDLSSSMLANDIPPNRLERAKREIIDLLNMLGGDRLGIVAFAGIAFVQCPLTVDYRLASLFINQLNIDLIPVQGTSLGPAIALAKESLTKASDADSQGKAIILITDGEDHDTAATFKAAKEAKESGIRIFTIGIGNKEGAPIPLKEGGFKKDRYGNLIVSKLDESTLEKIALMTDGVYVRSTSGDLDLEHIYKKGIKLHVEEGEFGQSRQRIWYERFQWFLGLAIALLFLEAIFNEYKKKRDHEIIS